MLGHVAEAAILTCGYAGKPACTQVSQLFGTLINIYNTLLGLAAFIAIIMIIGSGIGMLIYHYFEHAEQVLENSKLTFTRAITGFIIIAAAYLIVNTLLILLTDQANLNLTDYIRQLVPGSL